MDVHQHRMLVAAALVALGGALATPACRERQRDAETAPARPASNLPASRWAVSALHGGPDRPPAGRSLFDFATTRFEDGRRVQDIPYPLPALLARINARAGCGEGSDCLRVVLVPLGRSLQRLAASPDFFADPRVVAAVDREGDGEGALLKDRLYIGFQARSAMLEVISYNEAAGRFEFQLVHDYRAGGTPQARYARRDVCTACHQNLAPLFPRPLWAETNANPQVAAALAAHGARYAGVDVRRGVDIPNAIDDATDRANMIGVWQRLWRDGCGHGDDRAARRCRAALVLAALQHRLSGGRGFDETAPGWRDEVLPRFAREWRARWPGGLAIPNPDLPGRDPLQADAGPLPAGDAMAHVPARFDPLQPRPPLETWDDRATPLGDIARRYVAGLGDSFAARDIAALDARLRARTGTARQRYAALCRLVQDRDTLAFRCAPSGPGDRARLSGRLVLRGTRVAAGQLDTFGLDDAAAPAGIPLAASTGVDPHRIVLYARERERAPRLADGRVLASIQLDRAAADASNAVASVAVRDDIAPLRDALQAMADGPSAQGAPLSPGVFNRARLTRELFARLGIAGAADCCDDAQGFPPLQVEPPAPAPPTQGEARRFAGFFADCGGCHATGERSPPNFLAGTGAEVVARMRHCAPRLFVRLAMWRRAPDAREKTPMPPPFPSASGAARHAPTAVAALERIAAELLREETGQPPQLDVLLGDGYERLRPCLPGAAT